MKVSTKLPPKTRKQGLGTVDRDGISGPTEAPPAEMLPPEVRCDLSQIHHPRIRGMRPSIAWSLPLEIVSRPS